jgi:glutaminase
VNSCLPTPDQLQSLLTQAKLQGHLGQLPAYIPLLSVAQPHWCALSLHQVTGQGISAGDDQQIFPLMSIVKPFVVLFCLQQWGEIGYGNEWEWSRLIIPLLPLPN